jgi:hypothetical protein
VLLTAQQTDSSPRELLARCGDVFAVFDGATQDSGNVSYGVRAGERRLFVKTAGAPDDTRPQLSHAARVELLRNAVRLRRSVASRASSALPALLNVVESSEGPLLVYEWLHGELIGASSARRSDPASAFARFLALQRPERSAALEVVFALHVELCARGWIACDFYDGCLLYDFARQRMHVIDLDHYRDEPFVNTMGRMFGSARFMAPEEHTLSARIDERTTVFTLGRTLQQFLPEATGEMAEVAQRACDEDPQRRFASVQELYAAWSSS